jgi:hypothetical protein
MNKAWLKSTFIRALKRMAETLLASGLVMPGVSAATDWISFGWSVLSVLFMGVAAFAVSVLQSIRAVPDPVE